MKLLIKETKKKRTTLLKQGPCGAFCFKYWLGSGCGDDCTACDIKKNNKA